MNQTYLDIARQGKNNWWRYLLGTILIIFCWLVLGGIFAGGLLIFNFINQGLSQEELVKQIETLMRTPSIQVYLIINIQFIFFLIGIFFTIKFIHQRKFLTLVGADAKIRWQRFFQGFGLWFFMNVILFGIGYLLNPNNLELTFQPQIWFILLVSALILTPIQTSTEELFFRGYILQGLGLITKQPLVLMIINGVLFMVPHLGNPEVERGFLWMALTYFSFGVFASLLTLKDNRLELALGVHAANNLFFIFASTKDSAISVPAIWLIKETAEPQWSLLWFLLECSLFYFIIFGLRRSKQNTLEVTAEAREGVGSNK